MRPLTFGEVLDGALSLYRRHFGLFFRLSVVLLVVPVTLGAYFGHPLIVPRVFVQNPAMFMFDPVGTFVMVASIGVLYYLATLLLTTAAVRVISDAYLGRAPTFRGAIGLGVSKIWPLFVVGVAKAVVLGGMLGLVLGVVSIVGFQLNNAGLDVAADLLAFGLGFVGLWAVITVACGYGVTTQVVVLEQLKGALQAFGRSWRLTKGFRFKVFGLAGIAFLLLGAIPSWILQFVAIVWVPESSAVNLGLQVVTLLVPVILSPAIACVLTLMYYDLRVRREGFDLQVLSQQLGTA
jgi:hypothetical protein